MQPGARSAWAFHRGSSDDFNPSLAVGISQRGETVFSQLGIYRHFCWDGDLGRGFLLEKLVT
jgi:hypothetical protein